MILGALFSILILSACGDQSPLATHVADARTNIQGKSFKVELLFTGLEGTGVKYLGKYYSCEATPVMDPNDLTPPTPHPADPMIDLPWAPAMLEIYDNSGKLIGVPDSAQPSTAESGSCLALFTYSNFVMPNLPVQFKTSGGSTWDIPISKLSQNILQLNGEGAVF